MRRILLSVVEHGDNGFVDCFKRINKEYGAYVQFVEVINSNKERFWSSGQKPNRLPYEGQEFRGLNLYGEVLTEVYARYLTQQAEEQKALKLEVCCAQKCDAAECRSGLLTHTKFHGP